MLNLDATTKSLEVALGGVPSAQLPFIASYVDINQSTFAMTAAAEADGTTNSATAVTAVAAPGATTTRKMNYLSVVNVAAAAVTLTVSVNNNGTLRTAWTGSLAVGDNLYFTDTGGWVVIDNQGNKKTAMGGILPAANFPALSGDVTTTAGSLVTAIGALKVTNAMLAGSIAASKLVGTDIATVGTITSGVWNAGAVTSSGAGTFGGDVVLTTNAAIRRNTSDGSDNGSVSLSGGGGAEDATRSGWINVYGNEHASQPGRVIIRAGNVASSSIIVQGADGTERLNITGSNGIATFTSSVGGSGGTWVFNGTNANGPTLSISRSGTARLHIGTRAGIWGSGSADDANLYALSNLEFEGGNGTTKFIVGSTNIQSSTIAATTTATAANMVIESNILKLSTSSARYKTNIQPLREWRFLLDLVPITFDEKSTGRHFMGLTAENVAAVEPRLAMLDEQGRPDQVAYSHLTAPIILAIQELTARIVTLEG